MGRRIATKVPETAGNLSSGVIEHAPTSTLSDPLPVRRSARLAHSLPTVHAQENNNIQRSPSSEPPSKPTSRAARTVSTMDSNQFSDLSLLATTELPDLHDNDEADYVPENEYVVCGDNPFEDIDQGDNVLPAGIDFPELARPALWSMDDDTVPQSCQNNASSAAFDPRRTYNGILRPDDTPQSFKEILHGILIWLVLWAQQTCIPEMPAEGPIDPGYWSTLRSVDIKWLLEEYIKAIPKEVQSFFEKGHWSFNDIKSFPEVSTKAKKRGVYGNFFLAQYKGILKLMSYIGFSVDVHDRMMEHRSAIGAFTRLRAENRIKFSWHYHLASQQSNKAKFMFKVLALFDDSMEKRYVVLLESIFMILFDTIHCPFFHMWWTEASYHLRNKIRNVFAITSPIFGLNRALSIRGIYYNPMSDKVLPCRSCTKMTYPRAGSAQRYCYDREDTSKGYICGVCYDYRRREGFLPPKHLVEQWQEGRIILLESRGKSSEACEDCSRPETVFRADHPFRKYSGKWLCKSCIDRREEIDGQQTTCDNCGIDEATHKKTSATKRKRLIMYLGNLQMNLCLVCRHCLEDPKDPKLPTPLFAKVHHKKGELRLARERGVIIKCVRCDRPEDSNHHRLSTTGTGPYCSHRVECRRKREAESV